MSTTPASTARPTIERPTKGAKTSGKSVSTSIVNIGEVLNLGRFLAPFRRKPLTPYALALDALARGQFAEALERLDALLQDERLAGEQRAAVTNKRGVALVSLQRSEEARRAFEAALEIKPRYAPALVNIGNLHLESGEIEAAVARYEAAIAADDR